MSHVPEVYAIIDIAAANAVDYSQVGETNENTIRKSLDGTQFILKWEHEPTFITDGTVVPLQILTHAEASELMQTLAWQEPTPEIKE